MSAIGYGFYNCDQCLRSSAIEWNVKATLCMNLNKDNGWKKDAQAGSESLWYLSACLLSAILIIISNINNWSTDWLLFTDCQK